MANDVPQGFDPLANLVKIAHAHGIAVHAWFVNGSYGAPVNNGVFVETPTGGCSATATARPGMIWASRRYATSSAT